MVRSPVIPTKYFLLVYSIVSIFYKNLSEAFLLDGSALSEKSTMIEQDVVSFIGKSSDRPTPTLHLKQMRHKP